MFSKIKLYLYGVLAAIGVFLFGWIKLLQSKNNKLGAKVEAKEKELAVKDKVVKDKQQLDKQLESAKKQAEEVANENTKKRINRTRPSGAFGDKRLK